MAFSYDEPSAKPYGTAVERRYFVRMLLQDTDASRPLFQDELIDNYLAASASVWQAAADLAEVVLSRRRGVASKRVGQTEISYLERVLPLWRARALQHQVPYAAGTSLGDKLAHEQDRDAPAAAFRRDTGDRPDAADQTAGIVRWWP